MTHAKNNNSKTRDDFFIELFGINVKMVNKLSLIGNCQRPIRTPNFCRRGMSPVVFEVEADNISTAEPLLLEQQIYN